jgi:DNA-binding NtrC family response regulator
VVAAESGAEALRLFDQDPQRICVALIDATLKNGTSGREVYEALRARKPRLPVIIMSGFRETDIGLEFSKSNCCAFLPKPFMSTELLALVDKACAMVDRDGQAPGAKPADEPAGEAAGKAAGGHAETLPDRTAGEEV